MITQKPTRIVELSQTFPVKEIQKKKRLRARNARFSGAENTRENPRARGDGDDDNTYHNQTRYDLKYDLKKPSEPEEKERGREFFFVSLCPRESSFWIQRERERERKRKRKKRELRR